MATPAKAAPRIQYIDGLKLIMCYMIMLIHFTIAYFPDGYISFGSNYTAAERIPYTFSSLSLQCCPPSPFLGLRSLMSHSSVRPSSVIFAL